MATSNSGVRRTRENRSSDRRLTRYDVQLLAIPAAFLVALVVSQLSTLPTPGVMAVASLVGAVVVADGLFVNPPVRPNG